MSLFDGTAIRDEFRDRMDSVDQLLESTNGSSIEREGRGLAFVLMYAAYENLLYSLTRQLIETAMSLRVGNKRLKPGFRMLALAPKVKSIQSTSPNKIFLTSLPKLVAAADLGRETTLDPSVFPDDGSFMKQSQVRLWCEVFDIERPGSIFREVWLRIDTVVENRNGIAHGRLRADEVGRDYSIDELRILSAEWRARWTEFTDMVSARAEVRGFYRA